MEEESRRRLMDENRSRSAGLMCRDKNCNGIDCQYNRGSNDLHRHRVHDPSIPGACACTYCKDYQSRGPSYSPPRGRDTMTQRHHMDGATATNDNRYNHTNSSSPPQLDLNGTRHPAKEDNNNNNSNTTNNNINNNINTNGKSDTEDNHSATSPMTTLKMKLPDVRQGGNTIQISLEVGGVIYEGKIAAKLPLPVVTTNGHYDVTTSEAEALPVNGENNIHPRL
jgi:hypothetical protein